MRKLPAIEALYLKIDSLFEAERCSAIANSDRSKATRIETEQIPNDQAYFVLSWGQLETAIDEACRNVIRARRDSGNRTIRRAWELYDPDDKRLSGLKFENRASLVLDKERGPDCAWKKAIRYYNTRNQIAHGTLLASRIDIPEVVQDFFFIQSELEP
jgi:hypothetical protein